MTRDISKVTIHMVSSLDGFVEKKDGNTDWFETKDTYEKGVAGEDAEEFMKTIDCFVLGARTYELALKLGWPYGDLRTVVLTHRGLSSNRQNVEFYSGDLSSLVNERLKPQYKNIWLAGGPSLAQEFIRLKLADDIRLSILPIILGDGTPFFDRIGEERALHLKDVTAYKNGIVELWYELQGVVSVSV
jgi:dihydrofolate reductase